MADENTAKTVESNENLQEEEGKVVETGENTGGTVKTATSEGEPPAEWTPNLKVKVMDEEHDLPEWVKGVITEENEAEIRDTFEKALGLPHLKNKNQDLLKSKDELVREFEEFKGGLKEIMDLRDSGDLSEFFDKIYLDKNAVINWVLSEAQKEELPEEHKKVYNELNEVRRELRELKKTNSTLDHTRQTEAVNAKSLELDRELATPEISPLAKAFDTRLGEEGAFRKMVIRHGDAEYRHSGGKKELTAREAIEGVLKILNLQAQVTSQVTPSNESGTQKVVKPNKPVVLPDAGSSTASVTSPKISSLDDIRKIAKEMATRSAD
jgi:hypothetical protein